MSMIQVDFGQLGAGAESLHNTANQIQGQLDELEQMLKPLIDTWTGEAQAAYYAAQSEWDNAAQNLQEITAKMGTAVQVANESYQQGERANTAKFGG